MRKKNSNVMMCNDTNEYVTKMHDTIKFVHKYFMLHHTNPKIYETGTYKQKHRIFIFEPLTFPYSDHTYLQYFMQYPNVYTNKLYLMSNVRDVLRFPWRGCCSALITC